MASSSRHNLKARNKIKKQRPVKHGAFSPRLDAQEYISHESPIINIDEWDIIPDTPLYDTRHPRIIRGSWLFTDYDDQELPTNDFLDPSLKHEDELHLTEVLYNFHRPTQLWAHNSASTLQFMNRPHQPLVLLRSASSASRFERWSSRTSTAAKGLRENVGRTFRRRMRGVWRRVRGCDGV